MKNLELKNPAVFISSFNRPNLYYEVRPKYKDVNRELLKFVRENEGKSGIVYCLSRKKTEELAEFLQVNGIKALPYHAGLEAAVRRQNQDMFLMEEVDVMIATIAFGMGIDKPDIRYVVHYDMPKSLESYYQETGRSGRDGGEGQCIAFYSYEDLQKFEKFSKDKGVAEQEIAQHLLLETVSFAESSVCRRKQLLHYFGEDYKQDNCQCCDNCLYPRESFDAEDDILLVLDTITETKEQFKSKSIVDIILGSKSPHLKQLKADKLEAYGKGSDRDERFWNSVIRQMLIMNFIAKEIENYGVLKITKKGEEFLQNSHSIMLTKDRNIEEEREDDDGPNGSDGRGSGTDKALFAMLKDLRKQMAKRKFATFCNFSRSFFRRHGNTISNYNG